MAIVSDESACQIMPSIPESVSREVEGAPFIHSKLPKRTCGLSLTAVIDRTLASRHADLLKALRQFGPYGLLSGDRLKVYQHDSDPAHRFAVVELFTSFQPRSRDNREAVDHLVRCLRHVAPVRIMILEKAGQRGLRFRVSPLGLSPSSRQRRRQAQNIDANHRSRQRKQQWSALLQQVATQTLPELLDVLGLHRQRLPGELADAFASFQSHHSEAGSDLALLGSGACAHRLGRLLVAIEKRREDLPEPVAATLVHFQSQYTNQLGHLYRHVPLPSWYKTEPSAPANAFSEALSIKRGIPRP